jgi:N,N-dimethylformamidase beta subunit-like protein
VPAVLPQHARAAVTSMAAENQRAGSRWRLRRRSVHGEVEGFASRASVRRGQPVTLYVSTTAATYVVRAFRMGWYGGRLGRLVWTSAPQPGRRQTGVRTVKATHTVSAVWQPGPTLDTRAWPPGDYLLRLDAANGYQRFVPLAVRGGSAAGRVVLVQAVTTWQAYSDWGGYTLYRGPDGGFADRARAVSFDRPYDDSSSSDRDGAGQFPHRELPALALAERLGLPLEYVTDVDLQADRHLLDGARGVVTMGHDEYWSRAMRAALEQARRRGVNLAFLGANAVFRRIRLRPSPIGPDRVEVNYKVAAEDPAYAAGSADVTADWPAPPHARDESALVGQSYDCFPARADQVVVDPRNWLFAGTGARAGTRLHLVVGPESDRVDLQHPTPRSLEVLAHTSFRCGPSRSTTSDVTWYTTASGAGVFASGTIDWVCSITGAHCKGGGGRTSAVVAGMTANLLRAFAAGPAGVAHPARPNAARILR